MTQETNGNGEHEGGGVAVAVAPESGEMAAITEQLCKLTAEQVTIVRRVLETFNDGTFEAYVEGRAIDDEAENDEGADEAETAAGPPEYGNAGDVKRKVMAAFRAMGDEATRMLRIYIELGSIGGVVNCDLANEICDAIYNGKWQGAEVADAPGALWLSGFHDAIDMLNASS